MVTSQHVTTRDGTRLRVLSRDVEATGTPVVLVHGLASNARLWDGVADLLGAAGHPTHAVDLRGHGDSDAPPSGYGTRQAAADVDDVIGALGADRVALVGQSWGGNVVVELASRPDLVAAVVAVDGGAIDLRASFADRESAVEALTPPPLVGTPRHEIERLVREHHPTFDERAVAATMANFRLLDDATVEPRLELAHHLDIVRSMWDEPVTEALDRLAVPTSLLLVESDGGPVRPGPWLDARVAACDLLTVTWVADREHDVHAEDPGLVAAHVLDRLRAVTT